MTADEQVTVWHLENGRYVRKIFLHAHIKKTEEIDKSGIKQKGFFSQSKCKVRIPSLNKIDVSLGDYLRIGICHGEPDRHADFKITTICDNRRTSSAHYKLICER